MEELFKLGSTLVALEAGEVILYPTDTVWGLGCDATQGEPVARILKFKARPKGQGLIVLVDSMEMLKKYVPFVHPRLQTLLEHHSRPLTMIYEQVEGLHPDVLASDGSAAIRISNDAYGKALIGSFGKPIVSTSANLTGQETPAHYGAISSEVLQWADHVVKFKQRDTEVKHSSVIARWNSQNELEPIRE